MKTWTSHMFYQLKSLFTNFKTFSFIQLHETQFFTSDCKNTFSSKYQQRHLRIEWNTFLHDPAWKYHDMNPCSSFIFWSNFHRSHMILVVQPIFQVCEYTHFLNFDSHEKRLSSRKLIKIKNQASIKFSSLQIFKLTYCDSSPSLITSRWQIFESW